MILVLDNYDSFTYNLVQYLGELGADPVVRRNDEIGVEGVLRLNPKGVVISPGPGRPTQAGISLSLIKACVGRCPVLGVCLGHQAIGEAFGGRVISAHRLMHGKTSAVEHDGTGIFASLPSPVTVMRYHSLMIDPDAPPPSLRVTAWTTGDEARNCIMGVAHRSEPIFGVQFHPESIGTPEGRKIVGNFVHAVV